MLSVLARWLFVATALRSDAAERIARISRGNADAAFCVSQQGDICSWNSAAEQLFGYSASKVIGKSCRGLLQCRGSLGAKLCARVSFTPDKRQQNPAEYPTLTWKSQFDQAGGYGWICRPSSKTGEPTRVLSSIFPAISQEGSTMRSSCTKCFDSPKRLLLCRTEMGSDLRLLFPRSSNRSKAYFAHFRMAKDSTEIANDLGISLQTLRNHLHHVNDKLGTHDKLQAVYACDASQAYLMSYP